MSRVSQIKFLISEYFDGVQKNFADAIGKKPTQVSHWITGVKPVGDAVASQIETALDLPRGWLDGKQNLDGFPKVFSHDLPNDRIRFERLDVVAALGDGYINNEAVEVVDFVHVDKEWAREKLGGNLSRIQVITARGDSMQGTIEDGDVLFVDTSVRSFEGEGVYLLSFADGLKAKRLQASVGGGLLVISDNPRYRTETVEGGRLADLTICGRVRGAWHLSTL